MKKINPEAFGVDEKRQRGETSKKEKEWSCGICVYLSLSLSLSSSLAEPFPQGTIRTSNNKRGARDDDDDAKDDAYTRVIAG